MMVVLSVLVSLVYIAVRTTLFLFAEYTAVEKFFAVLLVLGDLFIILHSIGYAINIMKKYISPAGEAGPAPDALRGEKPSVAILVAARHEPKGVYV